MEDIINNHQGETFLITGGTGFIGQAIVRELIRINKSNAHNPNKIIIVARNSGKLKEVYRDVIKDNNIISYIFANNEKLVIKEKIDWIICAAAATKKQFFADYPADTLINNIAGIYHCLELAKEKVVKGLVFVSSVQVYGRVKDQTIVETSFGELDCMIDEAVYPESKRMGEALVKAYCKQYGVPAKCARLFHVYGEGETYDNGTFLSDFINDIINGRNIIIQGTGKEIRNLCYITDVVRGILLVLYKGNAGEAYNIASEKNNFSIKDIAKMLLHVSKKMGKQVDIILKNKQNINSSIIYRQVPNIERIIGLGWEEENPDLIKNFESLLKEALNNKR